MSRHIGKRNASCVGKVRFTSFSDAERMAKIQARRRNGRFIPYACKYCHGFHTGTSVKPRSAEKKPEWLTQPSLALPERPHPVRRPLLKLKREP